MDNLGRLSAHIVASLSGDRESLIPGELIADVGGGVLDEYRQAAHHPGPAGRERWSSR